MTSRNFALCFFALIAGSTSFAQPVQPPPAVADDPIVVTGKRDGDRMLSVDFQRVARECAECRRVLAQIEKLATPYQVKKRQIIRDRTAMLGSIDEHTRGRDSTQPMTSRVPDGADFLNPYAGQAPGRSQAGRLKAQIPHHLRKDEVELATIRGDVGGLVASFLAQLEPYVIQAAEAERLERGASGVVRAERRAAKNKRVDVTKAVIRRLDAMQFTITLPAVEAASISP